MGIVQCTDSCPGCHHHTLKSTATRSNQAALPHPSPDVSTTLALTGARFVVRLLYVTFAVGSMGFRTSPTSVWFPSFFLQPRLRSLLPSVVLMWWHGKLFYRLTAISGASSSGSAAALLAAWPAQRFCTLIPRAFAFGPAVGAVGGCRRLLCQLQLLLHSEACRNHVVLGQVLLSHQAASRLLYRLQSHAATAHAWLRNAQQV